MLEVDRAYSSLKKKIMNREIGPGYPVFDKEIAEELGMSRTPVREAIQRLITEGLVEMIPRKGVYIKTLSMDEIKECYEFAEALEGMVAYLVAKCITDEQIDELKKITEVMEESLKNGDINAWIAADEDFHSKLWEISNNRITIENLKRINSQIHRVRIFVTSSWIDKEKSNNDHEAIIEAFSEHDPDLARNIHQNHWRRIREETLNILGTYNLIHEQL
jgi:DNA-binding GntR family transcriptional regulator